MDPDTGETSSGAMTAGVVLGLAIVVLGALLVALVWTRGKKPGGASRGAKSPPLFYGKPVKPCGHLKGDERGRFFELFREEDVDRQKAEMAKLKKLTGSPQYAEARAAFESMKELHRKIGCMAAQAERTLDRDALIAALEKYEAAKKKFYSFISP